ncbi:unnamed protein product [Gongylonema pulchrum]|uniref:N-terminal methionine N(alpha)-acetyltransferase NatE n=1 Tax=Gongylonema pulchrum TaxID=637853 RepID=A0A183EMF0_9BILA|nr:unnamed protein product [Gongylonema pulchrum]
MALASENDVQGDEGSRGGGATAENDSDTKEEDNGQQEDITTTTTDEDETQQHQQQLISDNAENEPPQKPRRAAGRFDMELGEVTRHNVQQLKRLNQAVFPLAYNDKFYRDVVSDGELAKLAYFNDIVVGAVCCRIDVQNGIRRLYIMTLGTLAPYRRLVLISQYTTVDMIFFAFFTMFFLGSDNLIIVASVN